MRSLNHFYILATGAVILSLTIAGCTKKSESSSSNTTPAPVAVNAVCPVKGDPVTLKSPTVQYGTVTVGLCCEDCIETWESWTDEQKTAFVNEATGKGAAIPGVDETGESESDG